MIHWCPDETAALAAILGSLSAVTAWLKAKWRRIWRARANGLQ